MKKASKPLPPPQPTDLPIAEVLNSLPDGVYVTDTQRRILFWNHAAERITGWRKEDVVGRCCSDNILAHIDKDGHPLCGCELCPLNRSMVTGQQSTEAMLIFAHCKSGLTAPVEVSVAPIRDRSGRVVGGIELFRDVTESVQDMLRAKAIQLDSVACRLPEDPRVEFAIGYQPREIVGGDFYRIERHNQDHYDLFIADAMGHGVGAALHTMELRSLWEEHRAELESPARFLTILNQRLNGVVGDAGYFATAVSARYNAQSGILQCVRAGHPAPLLFRDTGGVESVGHPQLALGMVRDTQYQASSIRIEPGDALLLFTDGAVEIFDKLENELGPEGLKRLVFAQKNGHPIAGFNIDHLEEQLLHFSDNIHLPDDLTLLKLRRIK